MPKFNLNLRNPQEDISLIYLVGRWNGIRIRYNTNESIPPKYWDSDNHKVRNTKSYPGHPELNHRLNHITSTAQNAFRTFVNTHGYDPNKKEFINELERQLNGIVNRKWTLFEFIEVYIEESKAHKAQSTIDDYNSSKKKLTDYAQERNTGLDFNDIDLDFYYDFVEWCQIQGLAPNTIGNFIKHIKLWMNEALEREITTNTKHLSKRFKTIHEEVINVYLSEKEIQKVYEYDLTQNLKLDRIRDVFIIGCCTGLRISDLERLTTEHIKDDTIRIETLKTKTSVVIPLHPLVKAILKKYKDQNTPLPRIPSSQKMNEYIKDVCAEIDELKIEVSVSKTVKGKRVHTFAPKHELITSHTARRSFATNLYKSGFPAIGIMKITGHKTEKAFMKYIKVSEEENAEMLRKHWSK